MSIKATHFTPELLQYLQAISEPEHPILSQIRRETAKHRMGKMAIAPEQAALLALLARLINAKNYLEIGSFTGYSSTAVALALSDDARLTCCDINVSFTDYARKYWQLAGVAHKITLHLQPALITLQELSEQGLDNSFDMAFIDADKPPTPHYFESCLKLVRKGGLIVIDNLLLGGRIVENPTLNSPPSLNVLQQFNASLPQDERVIALTLPLGDGLTLLLKK